MPSDKDVGEFLEENLQFSWIPNHYAQLCEDWLWSGRIIEAMRYLGWRISAVDSLHIRWSNHEVERGFELGDDDFVSPRTIALSAAKALGMEVDDDE